MRAVLVLGGDAPTTDELGLLDGADLVVATDGGAAELIRRGRFPHLIVGDMDSLPSELEARAVAHGVPFERHPRDKAETDGELALEALLGRGARRIDMIGGHGGRSAMFLTHLRLLRRAATAGVAAALQGHGETLRVVVAGQRLDVERGRVCDVIALEPAVIDLTGFRYAGDGIRLAPWTGQGVSNVAGEAATLAVREGLVLVIEEPRPATRD